MNAKWYICVYRFIFQLIPTNFSESSSAELSSSLEVCSVPDSSFDDSLSLELELLLSPAELASEGDSHKNTSFPFFS